jgi:hypothetical protein
MNAGCRGPRQIDEEKDAARRALVNQYRLLPAGRKIARASGVARFEWNSIPPQK